MASRIICFICSILCYLPWAYISIFQKNSDRPVTFWSGDQSLNDRVRDIPNYNKEMAQLYRKFSWLYLAGAVFSFFNAGWAIVLLSIGSFIVIYFAYQAYKRILEKYS